MIIVQNIAALSQMLRYLIGCRIVYFDIESTGLDPYTDQLLLISMRGGGRTYVVNVIAIGQDVVLEYLRPVFEGPDIMKVAHNAVFDWKWLYHVGNVYTSPVSCTMINEQILKSGLLFSGFGLDDIAKRRLNIDVDKSTRIGFVGRDISVPFTQTELYYSGNDVDLLEPIYAQQMQEMERENQVEVQDWENRLIPITSRMEYIGVCIDRSKLEESRPVVQSIIARASQELQDKIIDEGIASDILFDRDGYIAINVGSPKQMVETFNAMGINVPSLGKKELSDWDAQWSAKHIDNRGHTEDAGESNEMDDLHIGFNHPVLRSHAIRTAAAKIEGTYITGLLDRINRVTGRIHPGFKQCGAVSTGRYSSVFPNFQNLPRKDKLDALGMGEYNIRSMFIPAPGRDFIISDYSGIELAILAAMSNDQRLIYEMLQGDIHSFVANRLAGNAIQSVLGELITPKNKKENKIAERIRDQFKPVSYGIIYGSTGYNLYRTLYFSLLSLGVTITKEMCDEWVERWKHELFPDTGKLLERNGEYAISRYYTESALGRRRRWTPDIRYDRWRMLAAMREGSNQPIQATCADMIKIAMVELDHEIDYTQGRLVACIHDELLVETDYDYTEEAMGIVKEVMEQSARRLFPNANPDLFRAQPKKSNKYDK